MSLDISLTAIRPTEVYSTNVTHNMAGMAREAGVYYACWRPKEINAKTAADLIQILRAGLIVLRSDPERFEKFNPSNGWGDYYGFVEFVAEYLAACEKNPDATIEVDR